MKSVPNGFHRFCEAVHQDIGHVATKEDFFAFALRRMSTEERQEPVDFVEKYNAGQITDIEMQRSWNNSQADFYMPDPNGLRELLAEVADRAGRTVKSKSERIGFQGP